MLDWAFETVAEAVAGAVHEIEDEELTAVVPLVDLLVATVLLDDRVHVVTHSWRSRLFPRSSTTIEFLLLAVAIAVGKENLELLAAPS